MYYPMMNIRSSHLQVNMIHNTSIYIAVFLLFHSDWYDRCTLSYCQNYTYGWGKLMVFHYTQCLFIFPFPLSLSLLSLSQVTYDIVTIWSSTVSYIVINLLQHSVYSLL